MEKGSIVGIIRTLPEYCIMSGDGNFFFAEKFESFEWIEKNLGKKMAYTVYTKESEVYWEKAMAVYLENARTEYLAKRKE